jgi:NAD(P)-dependent dehydrogenase (short-subunit alcohol dehydrogenase family)
VSGERLAGKVAIVTGGGRGLGRAMVLGLAAAGARVVTTSSRAAAEVESVAREAGSGQVIPMLADVAREEDCARVVSGARDRFGRVDILVNNAGRAG